MAAQKPLKIGTGGRAQEFASGDTVSTNIGGTGANNTATDGHILIGSTAGGDYVDGSLTSTSSTLTITQGSGTLNAEINGGFASAHAVVITKGSGVGFNTSVPAAAGQALTSQGASADPIFQNLNFIVNTCRLYGATGAPYSNGGASATTIYFGPCPDRGNFLTLDDGSGNLSVFTVSQISLSLASGFTSGSVYDVYVYNNAGTLTLDTSVWSNTTTPPTRGSDAAGRYTKTGATNRLLIGAIFMISNTATQDNGSARYISNVYNTVFRGLSATDSTASWTVTSLTFVSANGNTTNGVGRVSFLQAVSSAAFQAGATGYYSNASGTQALYGIGVDSTTSPGNNYGINTVSAASTITAGANVGQAGGSLTGVHFLQRLEAVQGTGSPTSTPTSANELTVVILN